MEQGGPAAPEPVAAEAPAEPTVKAHTDEPGLLSAAATPAADAAKPAEADAKPGEEKPAEAAAPVVEPLKYEAAPTLPEGVTLDPERLGKFDETIGAAQVPAETRQQLVDMFLNERAEWEKSTLEAQHRAFSDVRAEWRKEVMGDPELGGNGFQTNIAAAQRMINLFVPEARREAFTNMLQATGTADHPEMVRFLVNVARKFDEPGPAPMPLKPPPNIGQRPGGRGDRGLFYDRGKT